MKKLIKNKAISTFVLATFVFGTSLFGVFFVPSKADAAVCPVGNVKYEIDNGYEYSDNSATIWGDGETIYWQAAEGYVITNVCVKIGGPGGGSLLNPDPAADQAGFFRYDISHIVLTTTDKVDPYCGDGTLDPGEECDDGNNVDGDGCSAECTVEAVHFCGDGIVDEGEVCDDGNKDNNDTCRNDCTISHTCGNGLLQEDLGEVCDEGEKNGLECVSEYGSTCTFCTELCAEDEITGPYCGDRIKNGDEECDGLDGVSEGQTCSYTCDLSELEEITTPSSTSVPGGVVLGASTSAEEEQELPKAGTNFLFFFVTVSSVVLGINSFRKK